jgi:two-component system sensor histidine kinase BaeS
LAAVAGVLVALGMGFLLAGKLIKPIRRLTKASRALAQGNLEQQVPVTSQDELGQLTSTFNQMSADLVKADQQRKRLTADITHDLSTPLQVISGYVEMLEEGNVQLTPQRIEIIKTEIEHLRRLVGDLSTLTQVEAGGLEMQLQPTQVGLLMEKVFKAYQPIAEREGVKLILEVDDGIPSVKVDEGRMFQVLKNLIENALRYTSQGGEIRLAAVMDGMVKLSISDNGLGIDPDDLPYVFERFYRADKTRGANSGKMGLGLAICKALVNAQGGEISAYSPGRGQGTSVLISFKPAEQDGV